MEGKVRFGNCPPPFNYILYYCKSLSCARKAPGGMHRITSLVERPTSMCIIHLKSDFVWHLCAYRLTFREIRAVEILGGILHSWHDDDSDEWAFHVENRKREAVPLSTTVVVQYVKETCLRGSNSHTYVCTSTQQRRKGGSFKLPLRVSFRRPTSFLLLSWSLPRGQ